MMLLSLGLAGTAAPYILLYLGLRHIEASKASLILLLEPLAIFGLQVLFLGKPIFWWELAGGTILLLCGLLVQREESR